MTFSVTWTAPKTRGGKRMRVTVFATDEKSAIKAARAIAPLGSKDFEAKPVD
jgi:hypothetical protein